MALVTKRARTSHCGTAKDIVVNNAGYGLFGPIIEADVAAVHKQFETNVYGALAVCQVRNA